MQTFSKIIDTRGKAILLIQSWTSLGGQHPPSPTQPSHSPTGTASLTAVDLYLPRWWPAGAEEELSGQPPRQRSYCCPRAEHGNVQQELLLPNGSCCWLCSPGEAGTEASTRHQAPQVGWGGTGWDGTGQHCSLTPTPGQELSAITNHRMHAPHLPALCTEGVFRCLGMYLSFSTTVVQF